MKLKYWILVFFALSTAIRFFFNFSQELIPGVNGWKKSGIKNVTTCTFDELPPKVMQAFESFCTNQPLPNSIEKIEKDFFKFGLTTKMKSRYLQLFYFIPCTT
ncbi:MAG: hypothetical protein JST26_07835 [Bacteroidetes bacterium]|nr:hypothetical protein [Bacteroidota bacterium]